MAKKKKTKVETNQTFPVGQSVQVNYPMDHHHGRIGVIESVSHFNGEHAVKFDDNARSYYMAHQISRADKPRQSVAAPVIEEKRVKPKKAKVEYPNQVDEQLESKFNRAIENLKDALKVKPVVQEKLPTYKTPQVKVPKLKKTPIKPSMSIRVSKDKREQSYAALAPRKQLNLDIAAAMDEVLDKDEKEIESEAANKWASRACAVFILAQGTENENDRYDLVDWGDDLYHEALEHAALVKDNGKTVAQVQSSIEQYRSLVAKADLTNEGRKHIAAHNFAIPEGRQYPIHDISHARNALSRASGKPEETKVKAAVYAKYPSLKKRLDKGQPTSSQVHVPTAGSERPSDIDDSDDIYTQVDNLEAEILKAALMADDSNTLEEMYGMQRLVEGMDWELEHSTEDPNMAKDIATSNLEDNPDHYRELELGEDATDDVLEKDTLQTEQSPFAGEGFNLDLGSGPTREAGYLGLDTYPHDHGTIVHDLNTGVPFPDASVSNVRLCNVEGLEDLKGLLSEIHRVTMAGGTFVYEGPEDIYNYPNWQSDYPGFVLTNHEDSILKDKSGNQTLYRQQFTRVATPDPATANDAEPRLGIRAQDELPADALLAMDALGYYDSDATSSGRGNRAHGYASQGAPIPNEEYQKKDMGGMSTMSPEKVKRVRFFKVDKDQTAEDDGNASVLADPIAAEVHAALNPVNPNPAPPKRLARKSIVEKALRKGKTIPILKMNTMKQIVYGVVLAPNEIDAQEDFMLPEDIEMSAHRYLAKSRIIGSGHSKPIQAHPVESFIAPQDLELTGQYGPQVVKKGSWVLGVKVVDPAEWKKIVDGEYTGFSVGGYGVRQAT